MRNNSPSFSRRAKITLRALLCGLGIALAGGVASEAKADLLPVVLTIDYSNLSAVTVTATGSFAYSDYSGPLGFGDGIALHDFFTAPVLVQDFVTAPVSSTLTTGVVPQDLTNTFSEITAWNDSNPSLWVGYGQPGLGNGSDITLWRNAPSVSMSFSTESAAFSGQAVFNLSGYASYTNLLPALNSTGTVTIWNNNGTIGTWQVVGTAVPEPSTYAVLFGSAALGLVIWRRRPHQRA